MEGKKCKNDAVQFFTQGKIFFYTVDFVPAKWSVSNKELSEKDLNKRTFFLLSECQGRSHWANSVAQHYH